MHFIFANHPRRGGWHVRLACGPPLSRWRSAPAPPTPTLPGPACPPGTVAYAAAVRLYAARADRDSVIANARHCQAALAAHGAHVPVIDVGSVDHNTSLALAFPELLAWFQHLN